jgi:hypothetical protein
MGSVAVSLTASAQTASVASIEPPLLSAYSALPAIELMQLSPSGKRVAFVTVSGENRVMVLLDLATKEQTGGVGIGSAKVRDLDWVSEDQVLVSTTKTTTVPQLGLFNAELATGQLYAPAKKKLVSMLANTRGLIPDPFSVPEVVEMTSGPEVPVRAYSFENPERLDMFRIILDTGRGGLAEVMGFNVRDVVLDPVGKSLARSEYNRDTRIWSLHLRGAGGFREVWRTEAPIETPRLIGLGINGDSAVVYADRPDLQQAGKEGSSIST